MMRFWILLLCVCMGVLTTQAKPEVDSIYLHRDFDKAAIEKYQKDAKFDYGVEVPEEYGFIDWLIWKILNLLAALFSDRGVAPYIRYALLTFLILSVIMLLFKQQLLLPLISDRGRRMKFQKITEDIYNQDLEKLLQKSLEAKAYRDSIRIAYLLLLRAMSDQKVIAWEVDKTNRQYYYEIKNAQLRTWFVQFSTLYDYVWYGEFQIEASDFDTHFQQIRNTTQQVATGGFSK